MRYHVHGIIGSGPNGDIIGGVGDWLGAEPVAFRTLDLTDYQVQRLRVHAESVAMIGHRHLGLIEDITTDDRDGVLVATTLADTTVADTDPSTLCIDEVLLMVEVVAGAVDALHRVGLHHGHVVASNVMLRGDRLFLGDAGLGMFRDDGGRGPSADRRYDDVTQLIALADALGRALTVGGDRADALARLCRDLRTRASEHPSPRSYLAAFRRGLERVGSAAKAGAGRPAVPDDAVDRVGPGGPTPPLVPVSGPRAPTTGRLRDAAAARVGNPLTVTAAGLLVVAGLMAGLSWTSSSTGRPVERVSPAPPPGLDLATMEWSAAEAELTVHSPTAGEPSQRFRLGEPGDQFVLGDWDCSGQATPGLYRPSTGETYLFARWATGSEPAAATPGPVLATHGVAAATPGDEGCDVIEVEGRGR